MRSFGEGILKNAKDITASADGQIIILDKLKHDACMYIFSEDGHRQRKINIPKVNASVRDLGHLAWHSSGECFVVAARTWNDDQSAVLIYDKDGEWKRTVGVEGNVSGITVSKEGYIAAVIHLNQTAKVIVF